MSLVCSMHLCQQWLLKIHIVHPRMHASDTCVSHQDFRLSKERFGISIDCGWHRTSFLEPPTCDHWQSNVYHMLNSEPTLSKRCTFEQSLLQCHGIAAVGFADLVSLCPLVSKPSGELCVCSFVFHLPIFRWQMGAFPTRWVWCFLCHDSYLNLCRPPQEDFLLLGRSLGTYQMHINCFNQTCSGSLTHPVLLFNSNTG